MGRPLVLAENVFNTRLFPGHTLSANEEASGREVEYVGSGRRHKPLNHWTPRTTNAAAYVRCVFDRVRAIDTVFLDRGHNLDTETVRIRIASDSAFGTYVELGPATLPTNVFPYSPLTELPGMKTEEGAWGWRFGLYSGIGVEFRVDAMGAGLKPEIVGLQIGLAFRPLNAEVKPFTHGKRELQYEETRAPSAWVGAGQISQRRTKETRLRSADPTEYASYRYHIEELVLRGKPYWHVPDEDQAEKAFFARAVPQVGGSEIAQGESEFITTWSGAEQEPKLL